MNSKRKCEGCRKDKKSCDPNPDPSNDTRCLRCIEKNRNPCQPTYTNDIGPGPVQNSYLSGSTQQSTQSYVAMSSPTSSSDDKNQNQQYGYPLAPGYGTAPASSQYYSQGSSVSGMDYYLGVEHTRRSAYPEDVARERHRVNSGVSGGCSEKYIQHHGGMPKAYQAEYPGQWEHTAGNKSQNLPKTQHSYPVGLQKQGKPTVLDRGHAGLSMLPPWK